MQSTVSASHKILFIADVHLGAFSARVNQQVENDLIALIDYASRNNYQIALLGDIFDYWMEYSDFTPSLGENLRRHFHQFNHKSQSVLYITGNHDNWTLGHFTDLGFDVEPDYRLLHIKDKAVLLLHGDATGDNLHRLKRPALHRLIRHRLFLKLYRTVLPPKTGLKVMQNFSRMTRILGGDSDDTKPLDTWAEKMLSQPDIDYIICGHDHTPRLLEFNGGTFINTGSFYDDKSLVAYNNDQFTLVNWNSERQELIPFQNPTLAHE